MGLHKTGSLPDVLKPKIQQPARCTKGVDAEDTICLSITHCESVSVCLFRRRCDAWKTPLICLWLLRDVWNTWLGWPQMGASQGGGVKWLVSAWLPLNSKYKRKGGPRVLVVSFWLPFKHQPKGDLPSHRAYFLPYHGYCMAKATFRHLGGRLQHTCSRPVR